jgi:uncharacterized protein (DUF2342 family)
MGSQLVTTRLAGAFLLAGFLLLPAADAQQPVRDPGADETPAFNDWGARTFLIEVQPLVEKYTGWKHDDLPAFRLVTREKYLEAMSEEARRFAPVPFGAAPIRPPMKANPAALTQISGLLGLYSQLTRTIYLLPGNLKPVMRNLDLPDRFTRDLVEIVCAHEMTHAFQDEKHPFRNATIFANPDAREAYAMLAEGHAVFVQEQVARELKLDEAAQEMIRQMAFHEAATTMVAGPSATIVMRRYTAGGRFVNAVFKRSGLAGVQRLFDHPPETTAAVLDPELYFATQHDAKTASTGR